MSFILNEEEYHNHVMQLEQEAAANYEQYEEVMAEQQAEMSAASILQLFDTNKEQRMSFALSIIDSVESGAKDARLIWLMFKSIGEIESILWDEKKNPITAKIFKGYLMEECAKYGKEFTFHNAKFNIKGTGGKADYSMCNCPELLALQLSALEATEKLKAHEKFLQALPSAGFVKLNEDTGEVFKIFPPAKPQGQTIAITLN